MLTGLGMILGPLLGSALFTAGGYPLPFYFVSGLLGLAALLNFFCLEVENDNYERFDFENDESYLPKLFTNGLFIIASLLILPAWACMDYAVPFFAPFLASEGSGLMMMKHH